MVIWATPAPSPSFNGILDLWFWKSLYNLIFSSPEDIIQEDLTVQSAKTQLLKRFPSDLIESSVDPETENNMVRVYHPPPMNNSSRPTLPTSASSPSVNGLQVSKEEAYCFKDTSSEYILCHVIFLRLNIGNRAISIIRLSGIQSLWYLYLRIVHKINFII